MKSQLKLSRNGRSMFGFRSPSEQLSTRFPLSSFLFSHETLALRQIPEIGTNPPLVCLREKYT